MPQSIAHRELPQWDLDRYMDAQWDEPIHDPKRTEARIRNMLTEIEQQGATEMLNEPRVQVRVAKDQAGLSRFEKTHARNQDYRPASATGELAQECRRP